MQEKKAALDILNAAMFQQHPMIPQEVAATGQETKELMGSRQQSVHCRRGLAWWLATRGKGCCWPSTDLFEQAVLMPSPFVSTNGTLSNFVGPMHAAGLRPDLQGTEPNTQT
jgi:hypothetical protein